MNDPLEAAAATSEGEILGGVVSGERLHWECATAEEMSLTWAAFYQRRHASHHDLRCTRCGNKLIDGKAAE